MAYALETTTRAERELARLDPTVSESVRRSLERLAENAETVRHRALTGRLRGQFRLRVGRYRVLYELDRANRRIIIRSVGHRWEAYD